MGVCGIRAFREYDAVHFLLQHRHRCRGYREIKVVQNRYIAPDAKSGTIYRYCYYTVFTGRMQQKSVNSLCKIRFLPQDTRTGLPISRVLTRQSQKSSCKMPKTIPMKKPPQKSYGGFFSKSCSPRVVQCPDQRCTAIRHGTVERTAVFEQLPHICGADAGSLRRCRQKAERKKRLAQRRRGKYNRDKARRRGPKGGTVYERLL